MCRPTIIRFQEVESSLGGPGVELTTHLHLVPRLSMVVLYLQSLIHLHGVMLNYLSAGTTLSYHEFNQIQFLFIYVLTEQPKSKL
jgi:hypothetical protein